jgi:hypothetical protein
MLDLGLSTFTTTTNFGSSAGAIHAKNHIVEASQDSYFHL